MQLRNLQITEDGGIILPALRSLNQTIECRPNPYIELVRVVLFAVGLFMIWAGIDRGELILKQVKGQRGIHPVRWFTIRI